MVSWRRVWDWLTAGLRGFTKDATVMKSTGYLRRLIVFINSCWSRNDIHNPCIFHKVLRSYIITVTSTLQWSIKTYINPRKTLHNFRPQQKPPVCPRILSDLSTSIKLRSLQSYLETTNSKVSNMPRDGSGRSDNTIEPGKNIIHGTQGEVCSTTTSLIKYPAFHITNRPLCCLAFLL